MDLPFDLDNAALAAICCMICYILYSIYEDFLLNNDPGGRRLRSHNRRLRRKLRRLRRELQREGKLKELEPESSSSSSTQQSHSEESGTSSSAPPLTKSGECEESSSSVAEDEVKLLETEIELNSQPELKPQDFWQSLSTKISDFFSDEAVVPESDTDEEEAGSGSFVILPPEKGPTPVHISPSTYRKLRMNVLRQGHSWDPCL